MRTLFFCPFLRVSSTVETGQGPLTIGRAYDLAGAMMQRNSSVDIDWQLEMVVVTDPLHPSTVSTFLLNRMFADHLLPWHNPTMLIVSCRVAQPMQALVQKAINDLLYQRLEQTKKRRRAEEIQAGRRRFLRKCRKPRAIPFQMHVLPSLQDEEEDTPFSVYPPNIPPIWTLSSFSPQMTHHQDA
jgi:hypothetical protein